jgi:protein gp37
LELSPKLQWTDNIWMGVSVENENYSFRIDHLQSTGAKIKFLSIEPFLNAIPSINLNGIDWVIVGGESGPRARPIQQEWVVEIKDQCVKANVPFFFKQWGGIQKKKAGRLLDGRTWDEMPKSFVLTKIQG